MGRGAVHLRVVLSHHSNGAPLDSTCWGRMLTSPVLITETRELAMVEARAGLYGLGGARAPARAPISGTRAQWQLRETADGTGRCVRAGFEEATELAGS